MYQNELARAKRAVRKTLDKVQAARDKLAEATADLRRRNTLARIPRERLETEEREFFARIDGILKFLILNSDLMFQLWLLISKLKSRRPYLTL